MAKFKTDKYKQGVARGFEAGYTVDDIASAYPQFDLDAIQAVYDEWKANPQRGKAKSKTDTSIGPVTPTTRKAISKAKPADLPESKDDIPWEPISGKRSMSISEKMPKRIKKSNELTPQQERQFALDDIASQYRDKVARGDKDIASWLHGIMPPTAEARAYLIDAIKNPKFAAEPSTREFMLQGLLSLTPIPYVNAIEKAGTRAVTASKYIPRIAKPIGRTAVRAAVGATEGAAVNAGFAAAIGQPVTSETLMTGAVMGGAARAVLGGLVKKSPDKLTESLDDPFLENQPKAKVESTELLDDPFVRADQEKDVKLDEPEPMRTTEASAVEANKASDAAQDIKPDASTNAPVADNVTATKQPLEALDPTKLERRSYAPEEVKVDPEIQWKKRGIVDAENQVTGEYKNVTEYDTAQAGPLVTWERTSGDTYIAHGHHRLDIAKRAKRFVRDVPGENGLVTQEMPSQVEAYVLRESDGWTKEKVRGYSALLNIRDGKGSPIDAVAVIRDLGYGERDLARIRIAPGSAMYRDVKGLMKLSDQSLEQVRAGDIPESVAGGIGEYAQSPESQAVAIRSALDSDLSTFDQGARVAKRAQDNMARRADSGQIKIFGNESDNWVDTSGIQVKIEDGVTSLAKRYHKELAGGLDLTLLEGEQINRNLREELASAVGNNQAQIKAKLAAVYEYDGSVRDAIRKQAERVANNEIGIPEAVANIRDAAVESAKRPLAEIVTDGEGQANRLRERNAHTLEPAVKPRRVAAPETPNVAMQDVNENILISSAQKAQQKGRTINEWISTIRGSGTQYGEYNPAIRATIKPYEKSARLSELGIDPELDVTIYRGVPDPKTQKIVSGDFVTTDKLSAENYTGGDVVSKKVKAKDIVVEHADEFDVKHPFYEGSEFIYSDSKNKLTHYTDSQLKSIWERSSSNPLEPTSEGTFTEPYEQPLLHTQEGGHDPMAGTNRSMFGADEVPIERVEKPVAQKPVDEGLFEIPDKLSGTNGLASSGKYAPPRKQTTTTMAVSSPTAPIEMPELVEIAKEINGSVPLVKRKLRLMHGTANGVFTADPFNPKIELRADLFLGEKINSYSTKSPKTPTERTEIMNRLRAKTAEEMRVPEDDIVVRYERTKHIGNDVYHVYRISEEAASKTLAHEIGHAMDFVPDKTLNRGNVLGRIATLNNWLKTTIGELPSTPDDFLTTTQRNAIRKQARADIQKHAQGASKEELADAISERYSELVNQELDSRGLVTRAKIMGELKNLTQEWKPFDELIDNNYTKYRYSGKELYADLVSVWFNDAELARGIAPKTSKMLESYMKRKPEVKAAYDAVQNRYHNREAVANHRLNGIYKMIADGDVERLASANKQKPMQNIRDWITTGLIDKNWPALKGNASRKAKGGNIAVEAEAAAQGIEELNHVSALVNDHYSRIDSKLLKPMAELGITPDDIGTYMFLKRVQTDRSQMANPLGHTNKSATETMEALKARLGDERFQAVQTTVDQYRAMRESEVFPVVKDAGIYTPELMKHIEESTDYGKFAVTKYMESKFGGQVTAAVHHQYGTLQDIANPFTETILQDASMLVAAKRNTAKRALAKDLRNAGAIMPADMVYSHDIGGRVPKDPKNPELALFTYMDDGKPVHTYVDRDIAMLWKNDPTRASMAAQLWGSVTGVLRDVFVGKNVAWQARNIVRDYRGTIKNISQVKNVADAARLAKCYRQAFSEVASDVFKGQRSQDISSGYKEMALPDTRVYSSKDTNYNNLVEQRVAEMVQHISSNDSKSSIVTKQFKALIDLLDKTGRVSEMTGKLAGYKYLKQYAPEISAKQRAHLVRTRVGTPDYMRRGAWNAITNNIFMFSNVNKEGMRSGAEAFLDNPTRYAWKVAAMDVVPKLIIAGIRLWGANTPVGKVIKKADEYDRRMYNIVPIGLVNDGKDAIYLRIPQDYEGQAISAALYDAFHIDAEALAKDVSAMNPYRLNPLLDTAYKGYQLYALGVNPVDEYRQRNVISDQAYAAGGREQAKQFGAYAWNSLGGSTLMKMKSAPEILTDETAIQTALRMPGLNALGSFVRISHNGEISEVYDVLHQARKEAAQKQMNRKAMAVDAINKGKSLGDTYSLLVKRNMIDPTTTSVREFARTYNKLSSRKNDNPWVSAVENATSYEEMKALFDAMPEEQRDSFPVHTKAQARARFSSMGLQKTKIKPTKPKRYLGKNQDE
jgi:hypothetical protein